jgi:ribulose-phosphate 3-epimerase
MKTDPQWTMALPRHRLLAEFSLWSADLARFSDEVTRVDEHVDIYHIDVADGIFSPALLFFPDLVARLRKLTAKPFHVHLMMQDHLLLSQIDQFADAGADLISVHVENANAGEALARIDARGLKSGIVLQLDTPVAKAMPYLNQIAMLTLLGTRIGVKGQSLDAAAPARLQEAKALIAAVGRSIILGADGGIRHETVPKLRQGGAETIVMGSLAFNDPDLAARIAWVHQQ